MNLDELFKYKDTMVNLLLTYSPRILLALLTLLLGLWLIRTICRVLRKTLDGRRFDPTLAPFLANLVSWSLKVVLFISIASIVGIETTSFVAVLGAAGLAVGLALQGSLQNFAGGILILIFRPYKVGDLIEAQGELGHVIEIQIFTTILRTPDHRRAILPNGAISNGTVKNHSAEGCMRVDCKVGVSYGSNLKAAKEVLMNMVLKHEKVLKEPAPVVAISELADSSINIVVRPYAKPEDYWQVFFEVTEGCKLALDAAQITIPFPQRDVHIIEQDKTS